MGVVLFRNCNSLPEASVLFSCLEAGGFHPTFQNYNHANIAALQIIAFGGIGITIPQQELQEASAYIQFCEDSAIEAIEDFDPIAERRFGKWKSGTLLTFASGVFLPYYFLPAELLLFIWISFFAWGGFQIIDIASMDLLFALILLHAKYIALPKLRKPNAA